MSKLFDLEIMTPERPFYYGKAEAVTVQASDGRLTILADHSPIISAIVSGELDIKADGEWRRAFHSEGFMEVGNNEVKIFAQACEWPDEIDAVRAEEAAERAKALMDAKKYDYRVKFYNSSYNRAVARLKIKEKQ